MLPLFPVIAALHWQLVGATLFIGLPSEGRTETVCVEEYCDTPQYPNLHVMEWTNVNPAYISAHVRLADGTMVWRFAYSVDRRQG